MRLVPSCQWARIVTDDPAFTVELVGGSVPAAVPLGLPCTPDTVNPWFCSAVVACDTDKPMTLGTVTVGGPLDTRTVTVDP